MSESKGSNPSHVVYYVREVEGRESAIWTRCGVAWPHKNGKGYNMDMDFMPVGGDGKLIMLEPKDEQPDR